MKSFSTAGRRYGLLLPLLFSLVVFSLSAAQMKPIHLRNGTLGFRAGVKAGKPMKQSGLFVVQFSGPVTAELRAQLKDMGVHLLHYVPQDAFVASVHQGALSSLQALPNVQWVGEYQPEHKVHKSLTQEAVAKAPANQMFSVSVLLDSQPDDAELGRVRGMLKNLKQEARMRSGVVLRGMVARGQLQQLADSEAVLWIEPSRPMKMVDEIASKLVGGDAGPGTTIPTSLGYTGAGVSVAVADSGLNNGNAESMHPDLLGRTPTFFYYGSLTDAADEHSHGTHVAGIVAGNGATGETDETGALYGLGVAPGANIIAQRIFDGVGNYEAPSSFEKLTRDATRAGAVIGSNSWGDDTQGEYDTSAMEFDELVRDADALKLGDQQYILEFSAGNAGPGSQTIGSPAVAKNVIATGASENDREDLFIYDDGPDAMADFSSRGPCADGRIKPDVVAPGTWISSLQSQSASDIYAWQPIDDFYQYQGGTSQAGPHCSGAAAVFVQFYRQQHTNATPSPALVKAALINSATDLDDSFGTAPTPNNDEGWGLIDLSVFFDSSLGFDYVDQSVLLTTSQTYERRLIVSGPDQPLKVTLTYTDVPAFPGAAKALVNDLDLEVVAPDGTLYRGNAFQGGVSIPNAGTADSINNVEGVYLPTPIAGAYIVRVRATNVAQDSRQDTGAVDQDFALVTSGSFAAPGVGIISLDHAAYRAPAQIKVILTDSDLAGQPSRQVTVTSTTESAGEQLNLLFSDAFGVFTGSVVTATGPATPNGKLEIAHNDTISVSYFDASSGAMRTATARADLLPPVLTSVTASNNFGEERISWTSDEPATSIVVYGTNAALTGGVTALTNTVLTTSHSQPLGAVVVGQTYYYMVVSADEAGNVATNNNGGAMFIFVPPRVAPLLVIDEYSDVLDIGAPPISGYTNALNQIGIPYDFYRADSNHVPTLNNLKPYRAVIWRVPDFDPAWSVPEQVAISNYLYSGGSLLVASMEVLSRLEETGATNFIHNVLQTQSYIVDPDSSGAAEIVGSPNDPVSAGLDMVSDWSIYQDIWDPYIQFGYFPDPPDLSDTIIPAGNASALFHNDAGDVVGLRWPAVGRTAPGRLIFLTFPLDALSMTNGVNDRVTFLRNALSFLAPGASGLGTVALDSSAYNLPSTIGIEVGDADLAGNGTLTVTASSSTQTNGVAVILHETSALGDFVGSVDLISATNGPVAGKLRGQNGDALRVDYFDVSAGGNVSGRAVVDTTRPVISEVVADADYQQAIVSWSTSEDADALVQFGESAFLNRTASSSSLATEHAVKLDTLLPNHTYYYQVVSRDAAGNVAVDDNGGQLYSFHTLTPLSVPWFDNLDTGATNWSVVTSDESQSEWTLGAPNNGLVSGAHTSPNAWGSNLHGDVVDAVETYLVSPAIDLRGGNRATLQFTHAYDFLMQSEFDILNEGDLYVLTQNATVQNQIATYTDDITPGYVSETVDLTPYIGQVIYLVWAHELFTFDERPQPGWVIDDVFVTVTNVNGGTIQVSNNLWQASFVLNGPVGASGKGRVLQITNAPPGVYTLEFADVLYYQTPAPQTNSLASGGSISFVGSYTFADANGNGIPDAWELQYFGIVSSNRTQLTDTDGDGMSDYAEFVAGTDPNSPGRQFKLTASRTGASSLRLDWPSVPGQQYRLLSATNLTTFVPYSSWLVAASNSMTTNVPISGNASGMFRVQSWTPGVASGLPGSLKVIASRLGNGSINISWNASVGHGYQVLGTTNGMTWSTIAPFFRATNATVSYSVAPAGKTGWYRVEAAP